MSGNPQIKRTHLDEDLRRLVKSLRRKLSRYPDPKERQAVMDEIMQKLLAKPQDVVLNT